MKNSFLVKAAMFGMLASAGLSCKDDKADVPPEEQKLTFADKKWRTQAWELAVPIDLNEDGVPDKDLLPLLDECDRDNLIIFASDGQFLGDIGTNRCEGDDKQQVHSANWTYNEVNKRILLKNPENNEETDQWDVISLTETTLQVRFNILPDDGHNPVVKSVMTLKKQ